MRGLWRWWEEADGREIWRAKVEVRPGELSDLEASFYEQAGYEPSFWTLPLEEDFMAEKFPSALRPVSPVRPAQSPPILTALIIGAGLVFLLVTLTVIARVFLIRNV